MRRARIEADQAASQSRLQAEMYELRFTRFAESVPVGIATYNLSGDLLWAYRHCFAMIGVSKDAVDLDRAGWWMDFIHPEDRETAYGYFKLMMTQTAPVKYEVRIQTRAHVEQPPLDTDYRWILVDAYREQADANAGSIVPCYTDITSQKRTEELQATRLSDPVEAKRQQEDFIDITCTFVSVRGVNFID